MPSALIPPVGRKPAVPLAGQLAHESYVRPGPLVLGTAFLRSPAAASDRDRTVSRRSKPSSRTALMGEQPNPWDRLQPQDATSRHRGAKPSRRYGLLGKMSLLSPGYLLSVAQRLKGTPGITGSSSPRVHIDGKVWHLDVGSSHPGAEAGPKGWAVRPLKRYASWV